MSIPTLDHEQLPNLGDVRIRTDDPERLGTIMRVARFATAQSMGVADQYAYPDALVYDPSTARSLNEAERNNYIAGSSEEQDNPLCFDVLFASSSVEKFLATLSSRYPHGLSRRGTYKNAANLLTTTPANDDPSVNSDMPKSLGYEGIHEDYGDKHMLKAGIVHKPRASLFGTHSPQLLFSTLKGNYDPRNVPSSGDCRRLFSQHPALFALCGVLIVPMASNRKGYPRIWTGPTGHVLHDATTYTMGESEITLIGLY